MWKSNFFPQPNKDINRAINKKQVIIAKVNKAEAISMSCKSLDVNSKFACEYYKKILIITNWCQLTSMIYNDWIFLLQFSMVIVVDIKNKQFVLIKNYAYMEDYWWIRLAWNT